MTYDDLVAKWGDSPAAIGKALGVSRQRVAHWRETGKIPAAAQYLIQVKTRSRLKVDPDVSRETAAAD